MTRVEEPEVVASELSDAMLRFVMTLIVTTAMVAVTAYVLSSALLAPVRTAGTHNASAAVQHMRL